MKPQIPADLMGFGRSSTAKGSGKDLAAHASDDFFKRLGMDMSTEITIICVNLRNLRLQKQVGLSLVGYQKDE